MRSSSGKLKINSLHPIPLAAMCGPFFADSPSIPWRSSPSSSPAVSVTSNCSPPTEATPSIRSLVTPGLSYTMACFLPTRRLNSDDLPTFGRPTITTLNDLLHVWCLPEISLQHDLKCTASMAICLLMIYSKWTSTRQNKANNKRFEFNDQKTQHRVRYLMIEFIDQKTQHSGTMKMNVSQYA